MDGSYKHCLMWMWWVACFYFVSAEFQRFQHPVKADGSLSFLVIGDWGRKGAYNQSHVALQVLFSLFTVKINTMFTLRIYRLMKS